MAYTVPAMPLSVNVWQLSAVTPGVDPPSFTTPGCLSFGRREVLAFQGTAVHSLYLLVPALTDLRFLDVHGEASAVEVPAGSGRYYGVTLVDDVARGFTNEYRMALIFPTLDYGLWPIPIP